MLITLEWDNMPIIKVIKRENFYVSTIIEENIDKVKEAGMPLSLLTNIHIISKDLPDLIKGKLPNVQILNKEMAENKEQLEMNILAYINKTKCRTVTDKFTLMVNK